MNHDCTFNFRGLLTGKFKRGVTPEKDKSRIGFIHQYESKALECAPAWSKYIDNDFYWNLMDKLDTIAKKQG